VQIRDLVQTEDGLKSVNLADIDRGRMFALKRKGFSDERLAVLLAASETSVRKHRHSLGIRPVYKRVDTCAAEFASATAYMYSTYEQECEAAPSNRDKILVIGGGPNRIGQGIEFDYCCVHAALAMREDGYEAIMINCNPETVSTDYDTSDRLYFEPVTLEDVLEEIVGDIDDEHDQEEVEFIRPEGEHNGQPSFSVRALTRIEDFNEYFGTEFSDEEFDTIGGLVTHKLGRLPKRGETIIIENMSFKILNADNRRIRLMKVTLLRTPEAVEPPLNA